MFAKEYIILTRPCKEVDHGIIALALLQGTFYSHSAAVGVQAEVVSTDVVGYDNKPVSGYMFVGTDFINCDGTEAATVGDLQTNCDMTGELGTGWQALADSIVILDAGGNFVRKLVFLPAYIASDIGATQGWYDDADVANDDYTTDWSNTPLTFGLGIQVSADAGAEVRFAGRVKAAPTVTDVEGYMIIANCAPKTLTLANLQTNCDMTGELGTGWQALADSIVILDAGGNFVRKLVFLPAYIASDIGATQGWYDDADVANDDYTTDWSNTVSWASGEGFQVSADAGATITINSALATE